MNDRTRRALRLALAVIYDDLTACIEGGMCFGATAPRPGTLEADTRAWFAQLLEAARAVETEIGRHLTDDLPAWLPDIIDGRIAA